MYRIMLKNGLTVVLVPFQSSAVGLAVAARGGCRKDTKEDLHHALEHIMFRSTRTRPSVRLLAREWEALTDNLDAQTDETSVIFSCRTVPRHAPRALRLFASLVREPLITASAVRCEKERLREETGDEHLNADAWINRQFDTLLFSGSRQQRQPPDAHSISTRDIFQLHRTLFVARRLVLVIAGGFKPDAMLKIIRQAFYGIRRGTPSRDAYRDYTAVRGTVSLKYERTPKIVCALGYPTFGFSDPRRVALGIIRNHLSSRASSRLSVRLDSVGDGYASQDGLMFWHDLGIFKLWISVFPEKLQTVLRAIGEEIRSIRTELLASSDLEHAKQSVKIRARLRFVDPLETATFYARQWVNLNRIIPLASYIALVNQVSRHEIRQTARHIFVSRRLIVAARGPLYGWDEQSIRRLFTARSA